MNWRTWLLMPVIALLLGIAIAAFRIARVENSPAIQAYGSWRGTTDLPLNKSELVTTQVTLFALFALPSHEAVYLFAASDEDGNRLTGSHSYTIEGNINAIKAEYWSITAYGKDLYLIPNEPKRYSFNRDNLKTDSAGNFKIVVSDAAMRGNWLPVQKDKKFELVLRIYHGDNNFMEHLDKANLPLIKPN